MVSTKLLFECDHNRPQPLPPFKQLCLWGSCDSAPLGSDKRYGCVIRKTPPGQSRKLDSLCVATDRNCGCWGYVLDGAFMPLRGLMLYSKETKIVEVACDEWKKKNVFLIFLWRSVSVWVNLLSLKCVFLFGATLCYFLWFSITSSVYL